MMLRALLFLMLVTSTHAGFLRVNVTGWPSAPTGVHNVRLIRASPAYDNTANTWYNGGGGTYYVSVGSLTDLAPASWTVQFRSNSVVLNTLSFSIINTADYHATLSFSAVTYPRHTWAHALTNRGALVENYRLILTRTNGVQVVEEFTLEPGEIWSGSITDTNAFSVSLEQFEPSGLNLDLWNPETGLPPITSTNVGSPPTPSVTSTPGGQGNIWGSSAGTQLGALPSNITATSAGARGTNFSDAATATATADSNSEKRFSELGSLLVAQDARSAQRAGVQAAQMAAGLDRVRDAVLSVGAHLGDALTNGQTIGYVPGGSGPSNSGVTLGTLTNGLRSLWPAWSAPSTGATFQVAFPLSALHGDLSDVVLDFTGDSTLSPWVGVFRSSWLVVITVLFFLASLRLVGLLGGTQ